MKEHLASLGKKIKPKKQIYGILALCGSLFLANPSLTPTSEANESTSSPASSGAIRGVIGDLWADIVIGKRDFGEISAGEVVPNKVYAPGGVVVDTSISPGRMYIWDSGNNRILGFDLSKCYSTSSTCTADLVLGQPSASDWGACNQDASMQFYPQRAPASARTLCGVWDGTRLF